MSNQELVIQSINGKNYISPALLEKILADRDYKIRRIERATETRKRQYLAKTKEEFYNIPIPEDFKAFGNLANDVMESYISGHSISDDDGTPRCYYGNMGAPTSILFPELYRGEICDYGITAGYSSLGRFIRNSICNSDEERYILFFVSQMRLMCFHKFMTLFRQYVEFPFGTLLAGAIAQHYGLDTQFLDMTDDVKVALFFACCKHIENNQYRPITDDDLNTLGTQAVLYFGDDRFAKIIGYQPFCRCHKQRGYYIDSDIMSQCWEQSILSKIGYIKCYFDRTPELSKRIFNEFDGGKLLFPEDGLCQFSDEIKYIKNTDRFSINTFEVVFSALRKYFSIKKRQGIIEKDLYCKLCNKEWLLKELKVRGYIIGKKFYIPTNNIEIIKKMNDAWDPKLYAKKEGMVYTPVILFSDEKK